MVDVVVQCKILLLAWLDLNVLTCSTFITIHELAMMMTHIITPVDVYKLYETDVISPFNYLQVIKSKGGKESETEYFAALVSVH